MSRTPQPEAVHEICHSLHRVLGTLPSHGFPYLESMIPRNGIYILFEEGETGHQTSRIVRTGTHTGNNQLRSRLKQHFLSENKDRSIFRKNIGRCLLKRDGDPFLKFWEIDLTSRAAKERYAGEIDFSKQREIEKRVSEYIQGQFRFVTLEIPEKAKRLDLESKITSTVSHCKLCVSSAAWLGRYSPVSKIESSGVWQVNELYKVPLTSLELEELRQSLGIATSV